ncbi:hypothetical protein D3C75_817990 [compost metagenome]
MPHAQLAGDEARYADRRDEAAKVRAHAPHQLVQVAGRIAQAGQAIDPAYRAQLGAAALVGYPGAFQLRAGLLEGHLVRQLPSAGHVAVGRPAGDEQAKRPLVHLDIEVAQRPLLHHHAQHVLGLPAPGGQVAAARHHVGQSTNVHHRILLVAAPGCPL